MILSNYFPERWVIPFSRSWAAERKPDVWSSSGPRVENNAVANYFRQNKVRSSCCVEGCLWPTSAVCHAAREQEKLKDACSSNLRREGNLHQNTFMQDRISKSWSHDINSSGLRSVRREESPTNPHTTGKPPHCSEASAEGFELGQSNTAAHTALNGLRISSEKTLNHCRHGKNASRWLGSMRAKLPSG